MAGRILASARRAERRRAALLPNYGARADHGVARVACRQPAACRRRSFVARRPWRLARDLGGMVGVVRHSRLGPEAHRPCDTDARRCRRRPDSTLAETNRRVGPGRFDSAESAAARAASRSGDELSTGVLMAT